MSTVTGLGWAPFLPLWLLGLLALAGVAALVPAFYGRVPGRSWRLLGLALLLAWLAGPQLIRQQWRARPDIALLVRDRSGSMTIHDRLTMADQAAARIRAEAAGIPGLELREVTVPEAGQSGTRLMAATAAALGDIPPDQLAGVVALSDGEIADLPAKPTFDAPFHLLLPAQGEETDRRLRLIDAPRYGVVGGHVTLRYEVEDLGSGTPAPSAAVTIRRDGETVFDGAVPVGQPQTLDLPVTREGPSVVLLDAAKRPGEVSTVNNQRILTLNGVRDRLRVLLVSGQPDPGERSWRRLLKSDPAVDLIHFTILRPPDKDDLTPLDQLALIAFPERELFVQKIRDFDLIILDRFANQGILPAAYLANIAAYVRGGGALLLEAGPEFASPQSLALTPLGGILPAQPQGMSAPDDLSLNLPPPEDVASDTGPGIFLGPFRPSLTALGQRDPVTMGLAGLDPAFAGGGAVGQWYRLVKTRNVSGQVLMQGPGQQPLLILSRVGDGRVGLLLSDQIWLWARGHDGGGPQAELLRRIAHWLMKEPSLEENRLTATLADGHLTIERRSLDSGTPPPVTITDPDGGARQATLQSLSPGLARLVLPAGAPGLWRVSDGQRVAYAASDAADPPEWDDLRATATHAAPLLRASGGSAHFLGRGVPALRLVKAEDTAGGADWIGLHRREAHVTTGLSETPLLPAWAALALLLGCLLLAWRRESR